MATQRETVPDAWVRTADANGIVQPVGAGRFFQFDLDPDGDSLQQGAAQHTLHGVWQFLNAAAAQFAVLADVQYNIVVVYKAVGGLGKGA